MIYHILTIAALFSPLSNPAGLCVSCPVRPTVHTISATPQGSRGDVDKELPPINRFITIDDETVRRGYTIIYDNSALKFGLEPGALSGPTHVSMGYGADRERASRIVAPPDGAVFASPLYSYYFNDNVFFNRDLIISISIQTPAALTRMYWVDPKTKQWERLSGQRVYDGQITARTTHTSGYVAVLSFPSDHDERAYLLSIPKAVIVIDGAGHVFIRNNVDRSLPIASLTKLMTALVFLDHNPGWKKKITLAPADDAQPAKIYFRKGDVVTVEDLFQSMLIGSKNNSARALARSTLLPEKDFIAAMNTRARVLGMKRTHFADVTGLSEENRSSASDYAVLMKHAFLNPQIRKAAQTRSYTVRTLNRKASFGITTTNDLLDSSKKVYGKTGYTPQAGYNLAVVQERTGKPNLFVIILGAPTDADRFDLARSILKGDWK